MGSGCCVMDNPIGDFFRGISDGLSGGCSYTPSQNATAANSTRIANELEEIKKKSKARTEKIEQDLINTLLAYNDELLKEITEINQKEYGSVKLNLNIDRIREKSNELKKSVVGYASGMQNERLVLTDPELSKILKEENDTKRKKEFDAFNDRVIKIANDALREKVKKTVRDQTALIKTEIMARITQLEKNLNDLKNDMVKIQTEKKQNDTVEIPGIVEHMYKYELSCKLLDELE